MQCIYTYIAETNCVHREYSVAAILLLLFIVLISLVSMLNLLYFYISTFRSMCAMPNMAAFCSSLNSWFPGMLLTYFLNGFEIVPVAHIISGITFVFTFHMPWIYIVRSLYLLLLFNPLNAELNPIFHLLALLGTHHFLHVNRVRFNAAPGMCIGYWNTQGSNRIGGPSSWTLGIKRAQFRNVGFCINENKRWTQLEDAMSYSIR